MYFDTRAQLWCMYR